MKKILVVLGLMLTLPGVRAHAGADVERWNFPGSTVPFATLSSSGQLTMTDGIVPDYVSYTNPVISTTNILNVRVTTAVLVSQGTTYISPILVQPVYPQGLSYSFWATSTIQTATETAKSTMTIVGVSARGESISESVLITTTPRATSQAFIKITSVTFGAFDSIASTEIVSQSLFITLGSTSTFGVPFDVTRTDDIYKAVAFGVDSTSYTVNTAANTVVYNSPMNGITTFLEFWGRQTASAPPRQH